MEQRQPLPANELTSRAAVVHLLEKWGHDKHAPQDIVDMAALANDLMTLRAGQAVVRLGYTDMESVDAALKEKPAGTPTLEYLADRIDGIRPEIQRIVALQDGMPYYKNIGTAHHALQDKMVMQACANLEATLITTPSGEPCLVFADHVVAKRYSTMGHHEQNTDPIRQYLNKSPILAIGVRNLVLSRMRMEDLQTGTLEQTHITPSTATTEVQRLLIRIFEYAQSKKATNIFIQPDANGMSRVRMRRHGIVVPVPIVQAIAPATAQEMATVLHTWSKATYTDKKNLVQGQLQGPAGGQFTFRTTDSEAFFRTSFTLPDSLGGQHTESISARILARDQLRVRLPDLRTTPEVIQALDDAVREEQGMILVVGSTGSGKSTLVHAALDHHHNIFGDSKNRLSAENPVERLVPGLVAHSVSKDTGFDLLMSEILRQDPDVIFIGEMRDRNSASIGVRASNSGHLVFSTLHANNTLMAIGAMRAYINNRFVDNASAVMVSDFDMVNSLSLIIAQKLVPELCQHCRQPTTQDQQKNAIARIIRYVEKHGILPEKATSAHSQTHNDHNSRQEMVQNITSTIKASHHAAPGGCPKCDNTGFQGELPINEIFAPNYRCKQLLSDMLANNRLDMEILKPFRGKSLFEAALARVSAGETHLDALYI